MLKLESENQIIMDNRVKGPPQKKAWKVALVHPATIIMLLMDINRQVLVFPRWKLASKLILHFYQVIPLINHIGK